MSSMAVSSVRASTECAHRTTLCNTCSCCCFCLLCCCGCCCRGCTAVLAFNRSFLLKRCTPFWLTSGLLRSVLRLPGLLWWHATFVDGLLLSASLVRHLCESTRLFATTSCVCSTHHCFHASDMHRCPFVQIFLHCFYCFSLPSWAIAPLT